MSDSDQDSKVLDEGRTSHSKHKKHKSKKHKKHKSKERTPEDDLFRDALLEDVIKSHKESKKNKRSVPDPLLDLPPPLKVEKNHSPSRKRSPKRNEPSSNLDKKRDRRDKRELEPSTSNRYREETSNYAHRRDGRSYSPRRRDTFQKDSRGGDFRKDRLRNDYNRRDDFGGKRQVNDSREPGQPSYLNAKVRKHAEEVSKRKLLWQKGKEKPDPSSDVKSAVWQTMIGASCPGSGVEKFRKLMGLKGDQLTSDDSMTAEQREKQCELMNNLDKQYEVARSTTHMNRGVGLGFASQFSDWQQQLHNAINNKDTNA